MARHIYSKSRVDWSRVGKRSLIAVLAVVLLMTAFVVYAFKINRFSVSVQLHGADDVVVEYGDSYTEPGARLLLRGTKLFPNGIELKGIRVSRSGMLDENTVGQYTMIYSGSFWGMQAEDKRSVTVVDSVAPSITLTEDVTKRWQIGYIAKDNYDGDISAQVQVAENLGRMTFSVADSSGNMVSVEKSIPFYDGEPPQITLTGGEEYLIPTGFRYVEPGYSALDNADGIVTDHVQIEGEVNWFVPGIYPVMYTVEDSVGHEGSAIRNVEVVAKERPQISMPEEKTIYLTFDDGPGPFTEKLLGILDQYGVKATFFVKNSENIGIIKEIVKRGHSIGIHTVTHDYESVYASPEAYFEDLRQMQGIIYEQTGIVTTMMRFPGGSSNTVSKATWQGLMSLLTEAVQDAGYQYFDWNVDSNDAGGARTSQTVADNVIAGIQENPVSIVLLHDIHGYSVDAVEPIIQWALDQGYTFLPLTTTSPGFHHPIHN